MTNGWIKLHRQIQDCEFLWDSKAEPFDRRSAWIDLLLMANHRDKRLYFRGRAMTIKMGQRVTSLRQLAERWHWSRDKVRRYLDVLEGEEMIVRESDNHKTLLTIVNYEKFQGECDTDKSTDKSTDETQTSPQTRHRQDTNKNEKNDKNEKNNKESVNRFTPPTLDEVKAYCLERKNNVDPKAFFDYYSTGHWKDSNGKPVRNWKQRVITWEKHEREPKPKNKFTDIQKTDYDFDALEKQLLGG